VIAAVIIDTSISRKIGLGQSMHDTGNHGWLKQGSTSSGEVKKIYDDWADSYDKTLESWDYRAPAHAAELLRAAIPADSVLLDAGCGTGLAGLEHRAENVNRGIPNSCEQ